MDFVIWLWYAGKRYKLFDKFAGIGLENPKLSLTDNEAGELSFTIHPSHPAYSVFSVSMVDVSPLLYRAKVRVKLGLLDTFHGRLYAYTLNNDNSITAKFEGDLATLSDSQQRPENNVVPYTSNVRDTVTRWLRCHNAYTGTLQQVTFLGGGEDTWLPTTVDNYNDTLSRLDKYILGVVGGHFVTDYLQEGTSFDMETFNEETGTVNIWYEKTHSRHSAIPIRANLIESFSADFNGSDFYNAIIPLGAKAENEYLDPALDNCLTVGEYTKDVNGNPICNDRILKSTTETELIRERVVEWSEETSSSRLRTAGTSKLASDYKTFVPELTIKALDPGFMLESNYDYSDYRLLDWVTVMDDIHGVSAEYQILSIEYDIGNPANSIFTLSASGELTDTSYTKKYASQIKALQNGLFNVRSAKSIIAEVKSSSSS